MPTLTVNTIEGASYSETRTPDGIQATATRIAIVDGMSGDPSTALVRARAIVGAQFPYGSMYSTLTPACLLTGYGAVGFVEDSSAVRIELRYSTPSPLKGEAIAWTVEDDGYIQQTTTQLDPQTHKPIRIKYIPGGGGAPTGVILRNADGITINSPIKIDRIATLAYPEPVRRVVLSGILHKNLVKPLRAAKRHVNEDTWSGLKRGHWRFSRFNSVGLVFTPYRKVMVELDGLEEIDWSVFSILQDRHDNEFKCDDDEAKKLRESAYKFGVENDGKSGVIKAGFFRTKAFAPLFGISDVDQL